VSALSLHTATTRTDSSGPDAWRESIKPLLNRIETGVFSDPSPFDPQGVIYEMAQWIGGVGRPRMAGRRSEAIPYSPPSTSWSFR
jgi:hypothetical protein